MKFSDLNLLHLHKYFSLLHLKSSLFDTLKYFKNT